MLPIPHPAAAAWRVPSLCLVACPLRSFLVLICPCCIVFHLFGTICHITGWAGHYFTFLLPPPPPLFLSFMYRFQRFWIASMCMLCLSYMALFCLLCLLHYHVCIVSLRRGFVATILYYLSMIGCRIGTDTGFAGCRLVRSSPTTVVGARFGPSLGVAG